ncbi:hypothetical protein PpBr36_01911, partial [Pyricularia pennisetigena]|uniref:hypothetical protein n=1 Tax=Pyricularia pennisetigena TaxID=1578925 RepID=UPI0011501615
ALTYTSKRLVKMDSKAVFSSIPPFEATALDSIPSTCDKVLKMFESHKTKDLEWRKVQLRKLYWAVEDYTPMILEAMQRDFGKPAYEVLLSEISFVKNDCMFMLGNLDSFAKDEYLGSPHVPFAFRVNQIRTRKEPLGSVLIISPYNYPFMLLLSPLVGAIAAGCTAILKPSELAPHTAAVVKEMIERRLDPSAFAVVNGAVPEVNALLDWAKWDKIFYTGSTNIGKIIAKKAAETLTPVTLELGGINPAFVTRHADLYLAAKRLMWAKTFNAGQVCLSQNYVLVERPVLDGFIAELNRVHNEFFPRGARDSELARVINERHWLRMKKMLDESRGKIVMGGQMDQDTLFMEPTAVLVESADDSMVVQESFGPIFALMPFDNLDAAIKLANSVDKTPLALYAFGKDHETNKVINEMTSGGASINDSFAHAQLNSVAFGGVKTSGQGAYRGKASFDCFSHHRTIAKTPGWMESLLRVRYMPYNMSELKKLAMLSSKRPNFDRQGREVRGLAYWSSLIFGMGAAGPKGAFVRWLIVLVAAYAWVNRVAITNIYQLVKQLAAMR